ncbi:GDYXXLXY domain-containing protein [Pontibacillus salicampi]|uniref:GDYXXLXY domain-containing protein n=1 Tax=Pontibacillus salicampi TaxID=1449801 RepID=A0ABV6LR08_9BACI
MKKWLFIVVIGIQALYLIGMAASYYVMEDIGKTITLKTAPIDPSDVFYGDYVRLNYEISTIPEDKWEGDKPSHGGKVYVVVEETESGTYDINRAGVTSFATKDKEVQLTARYDYKEVNRHIVDYGIERYYVEDNTGEQYEDKVGEMVVDVAIAPWGQKRILSLRED